MKLCETNKNIIVCYFLSYSKQGQPSVSKAMTKRHIENV